jgi:hypothetical protein
MGVILGVVIVGVLGYRIVIDIQRGLCIATVLNSNEN